MFNCKPQVKITMKIPCTTQMGACNNNLTLSASRIKLHKIKGINVCKWELEKKIWKQISNWLGLQFWVRTNQWSKRNFVSPSFINQNVKRLKEIRLHILSIMEDVNLIYEKLIWLDSRYPSKETSSYACIMTVKLSKHNLRNWYYKYHNWHFLK